MNKNLKIVVISIIAITATVAMWGLLNKSLFRPRATGETIGYVFSPSSGNFNTGAESTTVLSLTPSDSSKRISGVSLTLDASDAAEIVTVSAPTSPDQLATDTFATIKNEVSPMKAKLVYTVNKPDDQLPKVVNFQIKFKGKAAGSGKIKINVADSQVVGNISGSYAQGDGAQTSYTFAGTGPTPTPKGPTPTKKPTPTPPNGRDPVIQVHVKDEVGNPVNVQIGRAYCDRTLDNPHRCDLGFKQSSISFHQFPKGDVPADRELVGAMINFGDQNLTVASISTIPASVPVHYLRPGCWLPGTTGAKYYCVTWQKTNYTTGTRIITFVVKLTSSPTVTPTPKGPTPTPCANCPTITPTPTPKGPTPTPCANCPTITPTPTPKGPTPTIPVDVVNLSLKLRFQGIAVKPKTETTMKVKVGVAESGTDAVFKTVDFVVGDNGIWSGSTSFDLASGAEYTIYIKGPKHLQKKICTNSPTETAPGTYRCSDGTVNLVSGDNNLDLSGVRLLVGDLPEQGGEGQNGTIDSYDASFIRQNLGSTDPAKLAVGDLNLDGIIDSQDFSLLIASLSVKTDEL